jgi:bifunctional non-homologous end joining protein LigD
MATAETTSLHRYQKKRNFDVTPEPPPRPAANGGKLGFAIQKHWARRLHYDLRLELDGVLLSWAVPKGPSYDPKEKRIAIHVEDHPVDYAGFEGTIPEKQYGAGTVIVWDQGTWEPVGDPHAGLKEGKIVFRLHGQKLAGLWELVKIAKPGDKQDAWMLFKKRDEWARPLDEYDVIQALPDSIATAPLGLVEEREARTRTALKQPTPIYRRL